MAIAAAAAARDVAASEREAARVFAAALAHRAATERRDTRVQEAKAMDAPAPEPRPRQPARERLVDVTV